MNETSEIAPAVVTGASAPAQADDDMHWGKILVVAGTTLLVFAITIVCSTSLLHHEEAAIDRPPQALAKAPFAKAEPYEIGIINQQPFVRDQRADVKRDQQLRFLHGFGWADRSQKRIHIPIEKAMNMVLAQQALRLKNHEPMIQLAPQSETEAPPPVPVQAEPQPTNGAAQPAGGAVVPAAAVHPAAHAKAPAAPKASSPVPASGGTKH